MFLTGIEFVHILLFAAFVAFAAGAGTEDEYTTKQRVFMFFLVVALFIWVAWAARCSGKFQHCEFIW